MTQYNYFSLRFITFHVFMFVVNYYVYFNLCSCHVPVIGLVVVVSAP